MPQWEYRCGHSRQPLGPYVVHVVVAENLIAKVLVNVDLGTAFYVLMDR